MQNENQGRLIDISAMLAQPRKAGNHTNTTATAGTGQALILEPRTIRHQERVEDLFYLLFRRTGA